MCRSLGVSLATFVITAVSMGIVWSINSLPEYRFLAILLLTISTMQLADSLLWLSIQNNWHGLNRLVSRYLILAILIVQWLVSYYGIRTFFGWSSRPYEVALLLAILVMSYKWAYWCQETGVYEDGYLNWCQFVVVHWLWRVMFLFFLVFPIYMGFPNGLLKWSVLSAVLITFLINVSKRSFGTRWCWSSNIISVLVLLNALWNHFFFGSQ